MLTLPFINKLNTSAFYYKLHELRPKYSLLARLKLALLRGNSSPVLQKRAALLTALRRYDDALSCLRMFKSRIEGSKNKTDRQKRKDAALVTEEMFRIVQRQEDDAALLHQLGHFDEAELAFANALALLGYVPHDTGLAEQIALKRKKLLESFIYSVFRQAQEQEKEADSRTAGPQRALELYERAVGLVKENSIHWLEMRQVFDAFKQKYAPETGTDGHQDEQNIDALLADVDYEPQDFFLTPDLADFELELIRFYAASSQFDKAINALGKLNLGALSEAARKTTPTPASSYESTILFVADKMLTHAVSLPATRLEDKVHDLEKSLDLFKLTASPLEFVELQLAELYAQTGRDEETRKAKAVFSRLRDKWENELELRSAAGEAGLGGITQLCKNLARVSRQLKLLGEEVDETRYWETYARAKRRVLEQFVRARQDDDTLEFYRVVERRKITDQEDEEEDPITQEWEGNSV